MSPMAAPTYAPAAAAGGGYVLPPAGAVGVPVPGMIGSTAAVTPSAMGGVVAPATGERVLPIIIAKHAVLSLFSVCNLRAGLRCASHTRTPARAHMHMHCAHINPAPAALPWAVSWAELPSMGGTAHTSW